MPIEIEHLPADIFGLSSIGRLALSERPRSKALGGMVVPVRADQIDARAACSTPLLERSELAERLGTRLARYRPHAGIELALEKLSADDSLAVVTGQQPGLAGGPLMHLAKALHATRVAGEIERVSGRPTVAIFWNHSDDHDGAEANRLLLQNRQFDVTRVGLAGIGSGRRPMSRIVLRDEVHRVDALRESMRQLLAHTAQRDAAVELFAPQEGESFSSAFTRTFTQLLGHHGLLVLEPDDIRDGGSRALAALVTSDLRASTASAAERLATAGIDAPLDLAETPWLFHVQDDARRALRLDDDGFRYDGESGSRNGVELAAEIVAAPDDWSPGVLLRPLVQDLCLPTVAYVGGFGELAYHALLPELRHAAGLQPPVFIPRASVSVLPPRATRALRKSELDVAAVFRTRREERVNKPNKSEPPAVIARLRALAARFASDLTAERKALAGVDQGLSTRLRRIAARNTEQVEKLAAKAARADSNRRGKGDRHVRHVTNLLTPRGNIQERELSTLQFCAELGTAWIDELHDALEVFPTEHVVVHVNSAANDA